MPITDQPPPQPTGPASVGRRQRGGRGTKRVIARLFGQGRGFTPAELWLHRNGFPALVPGYGTVRMFLRRPRPMIAAGLAWAVAIGVIIVTVVLVRALIKSENSTNLAGTDAEFQRLIDSSIIANHTGVLTVLCLVGGLACSVLGIGRLAFFSLRWFITVAGRSSGRLLTVLPLLLVAVMFFFLAAETWQSVGGLVDTSFFFANALIALLALGFLMARARSDLDQLEDFADTDELRQALPPPAAPVLWWPVPADTMWQVPATALPTRPLRRLEKFNIRSIVVLGKLIASLIVASIVGLFFLLLGFLAVPEATAAAWIGHQPITLLSIEFAGHRYAIFSETLRVSIFLATFSGLYFVVSATGDKEFARSLGEHTDEHLRTGLAMRAIAHAERPRKSVDRREGAATGPITS